MAESKRKETGSKTSRGSRRGVLRRGARRDDEQASRPKHKGDAGSSKRRKDREGEDEKVSSLLDSTSQASEEVKQLLEAAGDASKKIREAAAADAPRTAGDQPVEGDEARALIGKINKEVQDVLESADEAAEKIRAEARAEARRLIEETRRRAEGVTNEQMDRVSEMSEQVMGELAAVQGQLETLRKAFDQSIKSMGVDLGVDGSDVWGTQQNGAEAEEDSGDMRSRLGRRSGNVAQEPEEISEGARLLALQQLTAGVDAEVIEERLKQQFGIENPRPILEWMGIHAQQQKP